MARRQAGQPKDFGSVLSFLNLSFIGTCRLHNRKSMSPFPAMRLLPVTVAKGFILTQVIYLTKLFLGLGSMFVWNKKTHAKNTHSSL